MTNLYIKIHLLFKGIGNLFKLLKYFWFLMVRKLFFKGRNDLVLEVIKEFLKLTVSNYENNIVNSRTIEESERLLRSLINTYLETKSENVLNQILEVLKTEFIERNNNVN